MGKKFGVSFSLNRALGISSAKSSFARATGIPTTRQGRQRKMGSMMGCAVQALFLLITPILIATGLLIILT
jgi:hypothetical protein